MRDFGIPQEPHNLLRRRRKFYDGRKNKGIKNFRRNLGLSSGGGGNWLGLIKMRDSGIPKEPRNMTNEKLQELRISAGVSKYPQAAEEIG